VKADGKLTEAIILRNTLKISMLFQKLNEASGGQEMIDGGFVLTVALGRGKCAWELALEPEFGAR
jgi:hypothetical protein